MAGEMMKQIQAAALGPPEKTGPPSDTFLKSPDIWRRRYRLGGDFIGFQGHFEGHPVLPALAQIFIAQDFVQALRPGPVILEAISQAKFLSLVRPGGLVSAYAPLIENSGPGEWRVQITSIEADGQPETDAAFLRLKFKEAGHGL